MTGLEYQHIGHDPARGEIVLWSIDEQYRVHERRRSAHPADASWLDWSHEREFPDVRWHAVGRIEVDRRTGSVYISDPVIGLSAPRLTRVLNALEDAYPGVRWYLFGSGFRGETVLNALARRVAAEPAAESPAETSAPKTPAPRPRRGPTPELKLRRSGPARR